MKKKTIIILIVVAAVVFLLWKKGVFAKKETISAVDTGRTDIDAIITASGITGTRATQLRKEVNWMNSQPDYVARIQAKAVEKGRTYEQQLVIEAIYAFHYKKETDGWQLSKSQFEKCWKAIDAM